MKYLKLTAVFIASFVFRLNWRTLLPSEGGGRDEVDCGEAGGDERVRLEPELREEPLEVEERGRGDGEDVLCSCWALG